MAHRNIFKGGTAIDCQTSDKGMVLLRFFNYSCGAPISCGVNVPAEEARQFAANILACCDELERKPEYVAEA